MEQDTKTAEFPLPVEFKGLERDHTSKIELFLAEQRSRGVTSFIADASETIFIDSKGLSFLIKTLKQLKMEHCTFRIINIKGKVLNLLAQTGLDFLFGIDIEQGTIGNDTKTPFDLGGSTGLNINFYKRKEIGVFVLSGKLEAMNAIVEFKERLILEMPNVSKVLLDMKELEAINSLGINEILNMQRILETSHEELRICNVNAGIAGAIKQSGLKNILKIYSTEQDAFQDW